MAYDLTLRGQMHRKAANLLGIALVIAVAACGLTKQNPNNGGNGGSGGGAELGGVGSSAVNSGGDTNSAGSSGGDASAAASGADAASAGHPTVGGAPNIGRCGPDGLECASDELCVFATDEVPSIAGYRCASIPAACPTTPTCACAGSELCGGYSCQELSPGATLSGAQIHCSCPTC